MLRNYLLPFSRLNTPGIVLMLFRGLFGGVSLFNLPDSTLYQKTSLCGETFGYILAELPFVRLPGLLQMCVILSRFFLFLGSYKDPVPCLVQCDCREKRY